ncbi:MAG: DNA-binding response regulator [Allomuricauda sp.]|nr:MAG: DNA-binding response regulator [Allomuricauda sp.]
MVQAKTKIAIIDGDEELQSVYQQNFDQCTQFQLVGIYNTVSEALSEFKNEAPDVVISEINLKGINGITGMLHLRKQHENLKIILAGSQNDFMTIKKVFREGANGYLTKPLTHTRIIKAIESVENDGAALTEDVAKKVISIFQKKKYTWLSARENQIIEYLGQGATYKMIAEKLFVTPSTVNFHIQNIYVKLNVNSKSEALEKLKQLEEFGKAS